MTHIHGSGPPSSSVHPITVVRLPQGVSRFQYLHSALNLAVVNGHIWGVYPRWWWGRTAERSNGRKKKESDHLIWTSCMHKLFSPSHSWFENKSNLSLLHSFWSVLIYSWYIPPFRLLSFHPSTPFTHSSPSVLLNKFPCFPSLNLLSFHPFLLPSSAIHQRAHSNLLLSCIFSASFALQVILHQTNLDFVHTPQKKVWKER